MSRTRRIVFSGRTLVDSGSLADVKTAVDAAASALATLQGLPEGQRKDSEALGTVIEELNKVARIA